MYSILKIYISFKLVVVNLLGVRNRAMIAQINYFPC